MFGSLTKKTYNSENDNLYDGVILSPYFFEKIIGTLFDNSWQVLLPQIT